jgi:hypothetical protein
LSKTFVYLPVNNKSALPARGLLHFIHFLTRWLNINTEGTAFAERKVERPERQADLQRRPYF